jgi:HEAT repeat protein
MHTIRTITIAAAILAIAASFAKAQTNSKEIMAKPAAELVAILQKADAPVFDKAKACQRLAVVGTKDAVPALAALLPDEKLNLYARFGLEGITDPSVDAALRDAATKLQGRQLVGVLGSIGHRKDAQAVSLLKGLLDNSDATVASAAAGALGQIGTPEAAAILKEAIVKNSPVKNWIADGCLACADGLAASGKKAEALALLDVVGKAGVPKFLQCAALSGQMRLLQGDAKGLVIAQLQNPDLAFFNVALSYVRLIPGDDVTTASLAELPKLPAERQAFLLLALADRKEAIPMPVLVAASKTPSAAVRKAAVYALTKHGDATAAATLVDVVLGDAEVAPAAKEALKKLTAEQVGAAIVARMNNANANTKKVLIELLASHRTPSTLPAIRAAIGDSDEAVRLAAIASLGPLAELADIDILADKALAANSADTNAARTSLQVAILRMTDRDGCATKLAVKLNGASAGNQVYVLDLLGKLAGGKALDTVAANAKSTDPAVKDAAAKVLGRWLSPDAAAKLLDIAKSDADEKYQTRALRGYIRIGRQLQLPANEKLTMFRTSMELAKRPEEKRLAIDILSRIPSGDTIRLAANYLGDASLKDQAGDVAVRIAVKIIGQDPKAVAEVMQKVVDAKVAAATDAKAKQLLGQAKTAIK